MTRLKLYETLAWSAAPDKLRAILIAVNCFSGNLDRGTCFERKSELSLLYSESVISPRASANASSPASVLERLLPRIEAVTVLAWTPKSLVRMFKRIKPVLESLRPLKLKNAFKTSWAVTSFRRAVRHSLFILRATCTRKRFSINEDSSQTWGKVGTLYINSSPLQANNPLRLLSRS